jgi:hypothetical protein
MQLLLNVARSQQPGVAAMRGEVRRRDARVAVHFARDRKPSRAPSIAESQPRVRFVMANTTSRRNKTRRHANQF